MKLRKTACLAVALLLANWLFPAFSPALAAGTGFYRVSGQQILDPDGNPTFPIVKDTTPQTHAYITSRTLNFGGTSHEKTYFLRV